MSTSQCTTRRTDWVTYMARHRANRGVVTAMCSVEPATVSTLPCATEPAAAPLAPRAVKSSCWVRTFGHQTGHCVVSAARCRATRLFHQVNFMHCRTYQVVVINPRRVAETTELQLSGCCAVSSGMSSTLHTVRPIVSPTLHSTELIRS